jgi:hypothetical protein
MSWPRLSTSVLVLIGACANTCGTRPEAAQSKAAGMAVADPKPAPAAADSALNESRPAWQAAPPDSALTQRLRAARDAIETDRKYDLTSATRLGSALLSKIGEFSADGDVETTEQHDGAAPFVAVARNYVQGAAHARVKITDTAQIPLARHVLSSHLPLIGNEAAGNERGAFVGNEPTLLAHGDGYVRATALVGNHYIVQINVQGSADPNAAQSLLERLYRPPMVVEEMDEPDPTR